nr:MAG TPA: PGDYG protein [Caudoviricetes sp.]
MVKKYAKKPIIIEAVQWTGRNFDEIQDFVGHGNAKFMRETNPPEIYIITEYQALHPGLGDYIVKSSHNSFNIYTKGCFEETFKEAE